MRRVEETLHEDPVAPATELESDLAEGAPALKAEKLMQVDRGGIDCVDPANRGMLAEQRGLAQQGGLNAR